MHLPCLVIFTLNINLFIILPFLLLATDVSERLCRLKSVLLYRKSLTSKSNAFYIERREIVGKQLLYTCQLVVSGETYEYEFLKEFFAKR